MIRQSEPGAVITEQRMLRLTGERFEQGPG
jgi:hypothetical protein